MTVRLAGLLTFTLISTYDFVLFEYPCSCLSFFFFLSHSFFSLFFLFLFFISSVCFTYLFISLHSCVNIFFSVISQIYCLSCMRAFIPSTVSFVYRKCIGVFISLVYIIFIRLLFAVFVHLCFHLPIYLFQIH